MSHLLFYSVDLFCNISSSEIVKSTEREHGNKKAEIFKKNGSKDSMYKM